MCSSLLRLALIRVIAQDHCRPAQKPRRPMQDAGRYRCFWTTKLAADATDVHRCCFNWGLGPTAEGSERATLPGPRGRADETRGGAKVGRAHARRYCLCFQGGWPTLAWPIFVRLRSGLATMTRRASWSSGGGGRSSGRRKQFPRIWHLRDSKSNPLRARRDRGHPWASQMAAFDANAGLSPKPLARRPGGALTVDLFEHAGALNSAQRFLHFTSVRRSTR